MVLAGLGRPGNASGISTDHNDRRSTGRHFLCRPLFVFGFHSCFYDDGAWVFDGKKLDIVYLTKQPYVWGEPIQGFMKGRIVWRKGIITLTRQVYYYNNGVWTEYSKQAEQTVDYFQMNLDCGQPPYVDNFCYHFDCCVDDQFDGLVICGTRWVDLSDYQVVWPDLVTDSYGVVTGVNTPPGLQPFMFMDVWDNKETLVTVCPAGSGSV